MFGVHHLLDFILMNVMVFFGVQATKLYCFVHKVPVCGECICLPEHQICVVIVVLFYIYPFF